jgi:hypothetical protein
MKRTTIAAALALLMTSGAAMAWDASPRLDAVETTTLAQFTGSQKYNRCPRFRVIDAATKAKFAAAGIPLNEQPLVLRALRTTDGLPPEIPPPPKKMRKSLIPHTPPVRPF